jgi:hypothetical protein
MTAGTAPIVRNNPFLSWSQGSLDNSTLIIYGFFRLFVIRTDQSARDPASFQLQHYLIHARHCKMNSAHSYKT